MKIKNLLIGMALAGMVIAAAGILSAQSLGEIARQQKAKQASEPKAAKVYTNENMPHATALQPTETGSEGEAAPEAAAKAPEEGDAGSKAEEGSKRPEEKQPEDKKMTKEYWQEQYQNAKADLDKAQEESTLANDELTLAQSDQARQLDADQKDLASHNVATKQTTSDSKHAALDKAKQAMDDLRKQFEDSGAPADWLPAEENKQ